MTVAAAPAPARAQADPAGEATPRHRIVPLVDAHQHLLSPASAAMINGPALLERVEAPPELQPLLVQRGERWNDAAGLAELYTPDAILQLGGSNPPFGWLSGPASIADRVADGRWFQRAYRLMPVRYAMGESIAQVAGYYVTVEGNGAFGFFQLSLVKGGDGAWRIAVETPTLRRGPRQQPITAEQLVAALDSAGIRRAVVLSGAFGFGGSFDVQRAATPAREQYAKVRADNDWTAQEVARFPDRLVAFCSFDPVADYALEELDRCASSGAFRGVKLHLDESGVNLADAAHVNRVRQVFQAANRHRLPIVVHVGNNRVNARENAAVFLDRILTAAPDVPVQVAHLWGGGGFSEDALAAYAEAVAGGHPATRNLYFDLAEVALVGMSSGRPAAEAMDIVVARIRQIGLNRVFYGSDGALIGHQSAPVAWGYFRDHVPLTDDELRTIASNVPPYLR